MRIYFLSSFLLHILWETLQAPLYAGYTSFSQHFLICLKATATGDMLMMLAIYGVLALLHRDCFWAANRASYSHPATWILPVILGVLFAIGYELWAVFVVHRWQYTSSMPLLPLLKIGIFPLLQMIVIPVMTLSTSRFFSRL